MVGALLSLVGLSLANKALDGAIGPGPGDAAKRLRQQAYSRLRQYTQTVNPDPKAEQDLQRAVVLAIKEAAAGWIDEVRTLPPHETRAQMADITAACDTIWPLLGRLERDAYNRQGDIGDLGAGDLLPAMIQALPKQMAGDPGPITHQIRDSFEAWIKQAGIDLPPLMQERLRRPANSDAHISAFGQRALSALLSIIIDGQFLAATQAVHLHLSGKVLDEIDDLRDLMGEHFLAFTDQLARISNTLPNVEAHVHQIQQGIEKLEERAARQSRLGLDKKLRHNSQDSFLQLTFVQRRTPLIGREKERAQLQAFLATDALFSWWQIAEPGGHGKSRLALNLVDDLGLGWDAGFLPTNELEKEHWLDIEFDRPTLIVIDYAASPQKGKRVLEVIQTLAQRARGSLQNAAALKSPVRILILERSGYDLDATKETHKQDWLRAANLGIQEQALVADTAEARQALHLSELTDTNMRTLVRAWRNSQDLAQLSDAQEDTLIHTLRNQRAETWRPLFAMMIGGRFHLADQTTAPADDTLQNLLDTTLAEERKHHWQGPDKTPLSPRTTALNLACLATMIGGVGEADLFEKLPAATGLTPNQVVQIYGDPRRQSGDEAMLALGLPQATQGTPPYFPPREPDLLGEYMVLWALRDFDGPAQRDAVQAQIEQLIAHAAYLNRDALIGFLLRLGQDFPKHIVAQALLAVQWPESDRTINPVVLARLGQAHLLTQQLSIETDPILDVIKHICLILSAEAGHVNTARALLAVGAKANDRHEKDGNFPLLMAAQNGHGDVVKALLAAGANANHHNEETGAFPLLMAAQEGHDDVVNALLAAGANANHHNEKTGNFPLLIAAQNGHGNVVNALLAAGANINHRHEETGTFPLLMTAQNGHGNVVNALLAAGANVNDRDQQDGTFPLLMATQEGHGDVVKALLAAGANVNDRHEERGAFPLLGAVIMQHQVCAQILLKAGADPNMSVKLPEGAQEITPLVIALMNQDQAMVELLRAHGAKGPDTLYQR